MNVKCLNYGWCSEVLPNSWRKVEYYSEPTHRDFYHQSFDDMGSAPLQLTPITVKAIEEDPNKFKISGISVIYFGERKKLNNLQNYRSN